MLTEGSNRHSDQCWGYNSGQDLTSFLQELTVLRGDTQVNFVNYYIKRYIMVPGKLLGWGTQSALSPKIRQHASWVLKVGNELLLWQLRRHVWKARHHWGYKCKQTRDQIKPWRPSLHLDLNPLKGYKQEIAKSDFLFRVFTSSAEWEMDQRWSSLGLEKPSRY